MAKNKINSLDALKKMKLKKPRKEVYEPKAVSEPVNKGTHGPEADTGKSDEEMFFSAMRGVDRMDDAFGRQVETRPAPPPPATPRDEGEAVRKHLDGLVSGMIEFELEYSEEYMFGYVRGMDSKIFQKLKNGGYSREAHLDLHGMNSDQALDSLLFFIRESYLQGKRCVLLVTGRGTGSPGGQSVLKRAVQGWLTREPLRRIVLAFATAQTKDGGAGALYVLLRTKKKESGKVRWNRSTTFD